jgi:hypothetical protein
MNAHSPLVLLVLAGCAGAAAREREVASCVALERGGDALARCLADRYGWDGQDAREEGDRFEMRILTAMNACRKSKQPRLDIAAANDLCEFEAGREWPGWLNRYAALDTITPRKPPSGQVRADHERVVTDSLPVRRVPPN